MSLAEVRPSLELSDVDWDLLDAQLADRTLMTAADIARFFGVARSMVWHWERACLNYQVRGARAWPPTQAELRTRLEPEGDPPELDWWPTHPTVLPPVDVPSTNGRNRWFKGTIVAWGLAVKRLSLSGEPLSLNPGSRTRGRASPRRGQQAPQPQR